MADNELRLAGNSFGVLIKWTAVAAVFVILGFNLINFIQYKRIEPVLSEKITAGQALQTKAIAEAIRPARIRSMTADTSSLYARLLVEQIQAYAENGTFNSISILDTTGNIVFSTQSEYRRGDFYAYVESDKLAFNTALSGASAGGKLYRVGKRHFRGTFAPIADELGRTGWVLAVEAGAEYYELLSTLRRNLVLFAILSIVVSGVCATILFSAALTMKKMERSILNISKMTAMGQMAAGVAHDLRNPLAIIRGSVERLGKSSPERREELVRSIIEEISRIDGTIDEYLALSRSHSDSCTRISLGTLAKEVSESFFTDERKARIVVSSSFDDAVEIYAPPNALRRAIINILANAVEALPDGGEINIRTFNENARAKLVIDDNGPKIPAKTAGRIFEPFFTTKPDGTGVGLTLAKKIAEDAGGGLCLIESRLDGCAFEMSFPILEK